MSWKKVDSGLGIYCPRCGTQTSQADLNFCRSCGADLTLVTQAMAGQLSWRTHLTTKFDNLFLGRRQYEERESARQGGWNIFLGTTLLIISISNLLTSAGSPVLSIVLLLFSLVSLNIGIGNLRLYKRYLRGNTPPEVRPGNDDLILLELDDTERKAAKVSPTRTALPASVSEPTTKLLDQNKIDEKERSKDQA
jgi:ribosomal protein L37E